MVSRFIQCQRWINEVQAKDLTVPMIFARIVEKHPNKTCFIFENKTWTFKQVDAIVVFIQYLYLLILSFSKICSLALDTL